MLSRKVTSTFVVVQCRGSCAPEAPGSAGQKAVARSESCPSRAASYMKEVLSRVLGPNRLPFFQSFPSLNLLSPSPPVCPPTRLPLVTHGSPAFPRRRRQRTVGKVSSAIDAKAQMLAILYETDHRPNAAPVRCACDQPDLHPHLTSCIVATPTRSECTRFKVQCVKFAFIYDFYILVIFLIYFFIYFNTCIRVCVCV